MKNRKSPTNGREPRFVVSHLNSWLTLKVVLVLAVSAVALSAQTVITANSNDGYVVDFNADNAGDGEYHTDPFLLVGENSADSLEYRTWIPFSLTSGNRTAIASAAAITLDLKLFSRANVTALQVDIYGVTNRTSTLAVNSDFQAAASLLVSGAFTSTTPTAKQSFDVTAFVKAEAARSASSIVVFRLQMNPDVPFVDSLVNQYGFSPVEDGTAANRPTLTLSSATAPNITVQPQGRTNLVGSNVTFSVTAGGSLPLSYQWRFNGTNILGATNSNHSLTNIQATNSGSYLVVITNVGGAVTSSPAILRVLAPATLTKIVRTGNLATVSFTTVTGLLYTVQYKNALTNGAWTPLVPAVVGTGNVMAVNDSGAAGPARFYRVLTE